MKAYLSEKLPKHKRSEIDANNSLTVHTCKNFLQRKTSKGRVEKDKCHNGQYYKDIFMKTGKLIVKKIGKILQNLCVADHVKKYQKLTFTEVLSLIKAQILQL